MLRGEFCESTLVSFVSKTQKASHRNSILAGRSSGGTSELSQAVSDFRMEIETRLADGQNPSQWLAQEMQLPAEAAEQLGDYFSDAFRSLGAIPSQQRW